jgi:hypothetical protein
VVLFGFNINILITFGDSANFFQALSVTALKSTKWRFSSLNHQNFKFFGLVPKSPTHTSLLCIKKNLKPNISSLGPFKSFTCHGLPPLSNACIIETQSSVANEQLKILSLSMVAKEIS